KLLQNAYEEHTHPRLLANAINALGGDGDSVLNDVEWTYEPSDWAWHARNWIETCVYHAPWIEGLAGTAVGIEAIVPTIFWPVTQALRAHYSLSEDDLTWHEIHSGEVEQSHGNEGLRLLEKYVEPSDRAMVNRCRRAVEPPWGPAAGPPLSPSVAADDLAAYCAASPSWPRGWSVHYAATAASTQEL